jgi:glucosylceramidase
MTSFLRFSIAVGISVLTGSASSCSKSETTNNNNNNPPAATDSLPYWLTKPDKTALLQRNAVALTSTATANFPIINTDASIIYQTIDGFGYTLTGGSAKLIHEMDPTLRANLLNELFGNGVNSIGISYLRISIGASDLSESVFSYNDLPAGQTDVNQTQFSLANDTVHLVPVLQAILAINPNIKLLGSPWSAPVWMKDNGSSVGGNLQPQYYAAYAKYFVKYVQQMQAKGIRIDAITLQNEPENPNNNPSMSMTASQQADFVKNHLGPAFQSNSINTKIVVFDHNCDHPNYPIDVLNDAVAKPYIDGSAFHLYAGDISAMSNVHTAHPDKNVYFTEQWTGANGSFDGDFKWHMENVIIGSLRNWSKATLEWNLASDLAYGPHTPGGCSECKGAIFIDNSAVTRNVSYYIVAQASKFIPAGSVRIASSNAGNLLNVAFKTPAGKTVLLVFNKNSSATGFNIVVGNKYAFASLPAGAAATYIW